MFWDTQTKKTVYDGMAPAPGVMDQLLTESQGRGVPQWKREMLRRGSADLISTGSQSGPGELAPCDNCEGTLAVVRCSECRRNYCNSCVGLFVHACVMQAPALGCGFVLNPSFFFFFFFFFPLST